MKSTLIAMLSGFVLLGLAPQAHSQDYPTKPVTIIVPYNAGGLSDTITRLISAELGELWGQSVIVENRPGAGSLLGAQVVARAQPDGYTILNASYGIISNQYIMPDPPLQPDDIVPVFEVGGTNNILLLTKDHPANTYEEVVKYARENPGKMSFASSGIGSSPHIAAELFASQIGTTILHAPYSGTAPAMVDVIAGRVDGIFDTISPGMEYARNGDLKAIAIAAPERHPEAPDLPTFHELRLDFEFGPFWGFFVPKGTPQEIQDKIYADMATVLAEPDVRGRLEELGFRLADRTQEEFKAYLDESRQEVRELIDSGRLQVEQ